jgi:hypothetical protein
MKVRTIEELLAQYTEQPKPPAEIKVESPLSEQLPTEFKSTNHSRLKRGPQTINKDQPDKVGRLFSRDRKSDKYYTLDGKEAYFKQSFLEDPWNKL